jgi:hypothetical protein
MKEVLGIQEPYMKEKARLIPEIGAARGAVEEAKQAQQIIGAEGEVAATKGFAAAEKSAMQQYQGKMEREPLPAFIPSKENAQDLALLFSLVSVIGMVVGGGAKENAQASMSAMNGMLEGHQKGRADLYKQELSEFDKNFKSMVQKHAEFRKEMEDAVKLASTDKEGAMADAKLAATKAGSNITKAMLDQGRLLDAYKFVDESQAGVDKAVTAEAKIRADAAKEVEAERRHRESLAHAEKMQALSDAHAEKIANARAGAKATAADRYGFGDIVAGASNEAAAAIRNLMGLPFESTSGFFGGKQTNSLFTAPLDAFANTLTSESVQRYNTQSGKLGYNLAQLMSGGRAVRVSDVDQMNKILQIREGDTLETAASRIAEARQLAERTIEVRLKSPNTPEGLKEVFKENLQTIQETVPFTVDDINKFVANRDKSITFSQALSKRYPSSESAPAPANAGPGAPPSSRAGVETGKDEKGSFHYEYNQDKTKRRKVYD